MQAWLSQQQEQMRASSNITKALMPKTASLEQAGGLHRMVLRGHSGPIQKVLLAPGGTDVVTGIPSSSKLSQQACCCCILATWSCTLLQVTLLPGPHLSERLQHLSVESCLGWSRSVWNMLSKGCWSLLISRSHHSCKIQANLVCIQQPFL